MLSLCETLDVPRHINTQARYIYQQIKTQFTMNNLQREIKAIEAENKERIEHKADVRKRAKNMAVSRCIRKIVNRLGSIPKDH
jgi:translation initiation factor 2B subunit (eIF-2B alpha/beta/delta family)